MENNSDYKELHGLHNQYQQKEAQSTQEDENENLYPSVTIEEIDEEEEKKYASDVEEIILERDKSEENEARTPPVKSDQTFSLTVYDTNTVNPSLFGSLLQQRKDDDHSNISFGNSFATTFGSFDFAPSAPSMSEEEKKEYESWLRESQIADREQYHNHKKWHESLKNGGNFRRDFSPTLRLETLPEDTLSNDFKKHILNNLKHDEISDRGIKFFLGRGGLPNDYADLPVFIPNVIKRAFPDHTDRGSGSECEA